MARALLKPSHEQQQTAMPGRVDEAMVMGQLVKGHLLHLVGPQGSVSSPAGNARRRLYLAFSPPSE